MAPPYLVVGHRRTVSGKDFDRDPQKALQSLLAIAVDHGQMVKTVQPSMSNLDPTPALDRPLAAWMLHHLCFNKTFPLVTIPSRRAAFYTAKAMQKRSLSSSLSICAGLIALASSVPVCAQMMSGGSMSGMGGGFGSSQQSSTGDSGASKNSADAITAVAPPYDVDDVLRMHRAGLQDEVIVNALRGRYHPLVLNGTDRLRLKDHGVSEIVVSAMEDPYGIGLENVRASAAATPGVTPSILPKKAEPVQAPLARKPDLVLHKWPKSEPTPAADTADTNSHPESDSVATSLADLEHVRISTSPVPPTTMNVTKPSGPGVYMCHGSTWQRVAPEPIFWSHSKGEATKHIEGYVLRPQSSTMALDGGGEFLVIVSGNTSVIQYQLVRMRSKNGRREFHPANSGAVYTSGGAGDLVRFDPERLGPSSWLVSLRNLPTGDYGFLPPSLSVLHSTTDLASSIYTFHAK